MPSKIIYLCGGRGFCAATLLRKMACIPDSWRALGHEVQTICGDDVFGDRSAAAVPQPADNQKKYYGKWYRRIGLLEPVVRSIAEYRDLRHDKQFLGYVQQRAASFRPDLIWERPANLHVAGLTVARQLGIPYVVEWLDNIVKSCPSLFRDRTAAWEKRLYREADFVVVVSERVRGQLAADGVDPNKILVAFNAVDAEEFCPDLAKRQKGRRQLGVADDEILAGYLGSYAFYHDSRRLVLATDLLRKSTGFKLRILMLGDGKEYPECHALASRLGLLDSGLLLMKPRIPKEEVSSVLAALDIAILPGCIDTICPIKVQEYMAAGLPTVLPDYPANREVVVEGKTGVLFCPGDERSLAEALAKLAVDPVLCRRVGQNAREEVLNRFTWEKTWGAALQDILGRLTERRRSHVGCKQSPSS